ncbi:MAG: hypothetical protein HOA95_02325 [Planctomycetes bacterium]|nr:hypothetical protein [Planctomycetota bacterium]
MRLRFSLIFLFGFLSICPTLQCQTLYWIDGTDLVQWDLASATPIVLPTQSPPVTLSVDGEAEKVFYFREPFSLMSANLDGTGAASITSYPFGFEALAANRSDQRLYWINAFNGQLVSIGYDGSNPQALGGMFGISGIGIDTAAQKLYFTNSQVGSISRRNFDGTGEEIILPGGLSGPRDCCYDEATGKIYWLTTAGATQRCDDDGSNLETIIQPALAPGVTHLVVDSVGQSLYLSSSNGLVYRAGLDGSNVEEIYLSGTNITELAILSSTNTAIQFLRGDANDDGGFDIGDPIWILTLLFTPGSPSLACTDSGDINDDGSINIADSIFALSSLFTPSAPPPAAPYPDCGEDPSADALDCTATTNCP